MSILKKKILLFIFCLLSGGLLFFALKQSVFPPSLKTHILMITPMRSGMPQHYRDSLRQKEIMLQNILNSKNK